MTKLLEICALFFGKISTFLFLYSSANQTTVRLIPCKEECKTDDLKVQTLRWLWQSLSG